MKPVGFDVILKYNCRKCGGELFLELEEARTPGFVEICPCGCKNRPDTVRNLDINVEYKGKRKPLSKKISRYLTVDTVKQAKKTLMQDGLTGAEAKVAITRALGNNLHIKDKVQLIKEAYIQYGKLKTYKTDGLGGAGTGNQNAGRYPLLSEAEE